eukprot:353038-Chlamydomonas_euryale.AAC.2
MRLSERLGDEAEMSLQKELMQTKSQMMASTSNAEYQAFSLKRQVRARCNIGARAASLVRGCAVHGWPDALCTGGREGARARVARARGTPASGARTCGMRLDAVRCDGMRCDAWRGVAWRGVAWRGDAWRGVAWRCVAWRGVAMHGDAWRCDAMRCVRQ